MDYKHPIRPFDKTRSMSQFPEKEIHLALRNLTNAMHEMQAVVRSQEQDIQFLMADSPKDIQTPVEGPGEEGGTRPAEDEASPAKPARGRKHKGGKNSA